MTETQHGLIASGLSLRRIEDSIRLAASGSRDLLDLLRNGYIRQDEFDRLTSEQDRPIFPAYRDGGYLAGRGISRVPSADAEMGRWT